jgi:DNA-binding HxlR family transcriptional regulator
MSLIGTKWKFNFISFIGWSLRSGLLQKKISGISNKMFKTVRELEKTALFPEKFFR